MASVFVSLYLYPRHFLHLVQLVDLKLTRPRVISCLEDALLLAFNLHYRISIALVIVVYEKWRSSPQHTIQQLVFSK